MVNGLNTGAFDIHDEDSATEITDRALTMLSEFLVSNQNLELNSTFKVYLKILSVEHMQNGPPRKVMRSKKSSRIHVGSNTFDRTYNPKWAFNFSSSIFTNEQKEFFKNQCLLICAILGILQNFFFLTNGSDERFSIVANLMSKVKVKRERAISMLQHEMNELFSVTKLQRTGPYELKSTIRLLHETYKCQFYIFNGLSNSTKLFYSYPIEYDHKLMPIFLYLPKIEPLHTIFIKNIHHFLGEKCSFCLACNRSFKRRYNQHLCRVAESCFTCRRLLQSPETFIHDRLKPYFCDKNMYPSVSNSLKSCEICNLPIYSEQCKLNHRKICNGQGGFGFYCPHCKQFTSGRTQKVKLNHKCEYEPKCTICYEKKEEDHLCKLKKEKHTAIQPRLAFIDIQFFASKSENTDENEPSCLAVVYLEIRRGTLKKYIFADNKLNLDYSMEHEIVHDYLPDCLKKQNFASKFPKPRSIIATCIEKLKITKDPDCLTKLLNFILHIDNTCTTYICADPDSQILMTLLRGLINNGICPKMLKKDKNIKVLEIPEISVRFLNSNNYLCGEIHEIASMFEIDRSELNFFPQQFLTDSNLDYSGMIPSIEHFLTFSDCDQSIAAKNAFVKSYKNRTWKLSNELIKFSESRITLLTLTFLKFLKECFSLQDSLITFCPHQLNQYVHPFGFPICTIGGFIFKVYKLFFMNELPIYSVHHEFGFPMRQVSKAEYEFTSFQEYLLNDVNCRSAFNNRYGQKYFKHCIPDLYSPTTNELYFYNGCFVHAHLQNCTINKTKMPDSPHPYGKTYKDINELFYSKLENCMLHNPEIKTVHVIWECEFKKTKQSNEFKLFYDNHFIPHPLVRLKPRDAIRGALSDVYSLKWSKKIFPSETFYCLDVNGLYSYCAVHYPYMIDKYDIVMGHKLKNIEIKDNLFYYHGQHIQGAILLTILPPSDLEYPFLMYRKKNGSVILTLCKECAEIESFHCNHNERERSLTGTYMISEIEFALKLGYKIHFIFEAHCYTKSDYILRDLVKLLNCLKIKATDCFLNCQSEKEKERLCAYINERMGLDNLDDLITPMNVKPNLAKKNFYKLLSNSLFGKFIERSDRPQARYVHSQSEIDELFLNGSKIVDFCCITDEICLIHTDVNKLKLPPNRNHNIYIGGQITAFAREVIYSYMNKLLQIPSCKMYQIECDSLFFSLPNDECCNLKLSPCLGDFKNVYNGPILGYFSLGQKQYCINYAHDTKVNSSFKVSGLSLKNSYNSNLMTDNTFEVFLDQFVEGFNVSKEFKQAKSSGDFVNMKVISYQQKYTLTNKLSRKRFVNVFDQRLKTHPYGLKFV